MNFMNFEQFTEELGAAYTGASVISATEQPLVVAVDGQLVDINGLLAAHQPCWLRVDKAEIKADGQDSALVRVEFPSRANLEVWLVITHGASVIEETVVLDGTGKGELEVVSSTPGEILVAVKDKPVRVSFMVKEVG
jgi:hypothetical protein